MEPSFSTSVALVIAVVAAIFIFQTFKIVPQQNAWVVERLGKYDRTLAPGLEFVWPFLERVAYKHSLKEVPLDVPSQVCITRDNTQLQVDGIIYFQVTDPMRASYGSSNYISAITQLAQTLLRSVIGKMELDRRSRSATTSTSRSSRARRGGAELGRQGAALRDQGPDAAGGDPARDAGADHGRAREARPDRRLRGQEAGADQHRHRRARGVHRALRGPAPGRDQPGAGRGAAIVAVAEATAEAIRKVAEAIRQPGGEQAVQLKVAQQAVEAFAQLAQKNNSMIVPSSLGRRLRPDRERDGADAKRRRAAGLRMAAHGPRDEASPLSRAGRVRR
jgi:regulator of protease activity HflC (stomatin/prohibitin superfamily)